VYLLVFHAYFLQGILIFKGLTARRLYKAFGVRGLRGESTLETEIGRTRSHFVDNWLWKRLWACRKTDHIHVMVIRYEHKPPIRYLLKVL
jgi:hypothetical protein